MNEARVFKRRRLTAVFAVVASAAVLGMAMPVSADSFQEYQEWPELCDVVAVSRLAAGDPVIDYEREEWIRFDVNLDGAVSEKDAEIMAEYVQKTALFDAVCMIEFGDAFREMQYGFRTEMSERFNTPMPYVSVFYGFRPDEVLRYYPDYVMIDRVFTIADGGLTGYAIQEDPFCGDLVYEQQYQTGDIVVIYNVFVEGKGEIVESREFCIGNVAQFGYEYEPNQEIVARALRNID